MYEDRSAPDSQTSKSQFPSSLPPGFEGFCRPLVLNGDVLFHFNVEPALGLVTPTSVTVTVNPSQVELLRGEADRLRAKAEHLKQQLDSGNIAANLVLLRSSLQEAMTDLDKTEANYKERGVDSSSTQAVNVFFDEIRLHYDAARNVLDNNSILAPQTRPRLERVSTALGESTPRLNSASKAVVDSISHNAMAYLVAASSGTMVLNLDVFSEPKGATVSYRQRTETEFRVLDHKTDCQIPNLYRAGYLIRFQKQGYKEQVVSFNGQDSTTTSISVDLAPEGRP